MSQLGELGVKNNLDEHSNHAGRTKNRFGRSNSILSGHYDRALRKINKCTGTKKQQQTETIIKSIKYAKG